MTEATLQMDKRARRALAPSQIERTGPAEPEQAPTCPVCGAATARQMANSGPRVGMEYWGCVTFPACRGMVAIGGMTEDQPRSHAPKTDRRADGVRMATSRAGASIVSLVDDAPAPPSSSVRTARQARVGSSGAEPAWPGATPPAPEVVPVRPPVPAATAVPGAWLTAPAAASSAATAAAFATAVAGTRVRLALGHVAAAAARATEDILRPARPATGLSAEASGSAQAPVVGRNVAGASAQAEFERRRALHRMKMRGALPAVVGVTLIAMAMAFVVLLSRGLVPAGLGAVAAGGIGVWAIGRLPADALAWARGAAGERRTSDFLSELEAADYVVLHDRHVPGLRGNIDHVAIGPAGIFVIETKNLRGKLTIIGEKLFVGERTRTSVIDATYRPAIALQVCLADRLNVLRQTVRPVLCIHRTPQLLLDNEVRGVRVVSGTQLAPYVRRLPVVFDPETVQDLASIADTRLPPAHR